MFVEVKVLHGNIEIFKPLHFLSIGFRLDGLTLTWFSMRSMQLDYIVSCIRVWFNPTTDEGATEQSTEALIKVQTK